MYKNTDYDAIIAMLLYAINGSLLLFELSDDYYSAHRILLNTRRALDDVLENGQCAMSRCEEISLDYDNIVKKLEAYRSKDN